VNLIKKPIRTCINCRGKFNQKTLLRLQCKDKVLSGFDGDGRSFYVCHECINSDKKRLVKSIFRQCKNKADYEKQLKEIIEIWMIK
jgi:predicted RNA-binding protein YlxR (DUF448 family)